MRDQYAGDVSDVLKFALLRALARSDRTLGIAWYYCPSDDGCRDGRHLEWRHDAAWRHLDEALHTELSALCDRSIAALEYASIWPPRTLFHREPIPSAAGRTDWGVRKRQALDGADIVFLDPDNGIGAATEKHATFSEVRLLRRPGRAIVFISFPGRNMRHDALLRQLHERLEVEADVKDAITLRTNVSIPREPESSYYVQRQRWFTIVDPDAELLHRVHRFMMALSTVSRVTALLDRTDSIPANRLSIFDRENAGL